MKKKDDAYGDVEYDFRLRFNRDTVAIYFGGNSDACQRWYKEHISIDMESKDKFTTGNFQTITCDLHH